ncbi:DUF6894 family protein [Microvirga massiliensis]|uniref:DUF6894 family protein n=1 Tax=Microvirga massiliensis TaxID=1033741 RepID=UPI00062B7048|nr:hypothetical protein [Microvirga massiliensis]
MVRLYFHLVSEHEAILDPVGLEVADVDEAYSEARTMIEEFKRESPLPEAERYGWRLEAGTHTGAVVFSIPFDHVHH